MAVAAWLGKQGVSILILCAVPPIPSIMASTAQQAQASPGRMYSQKPRLTLLKMSPSGRMLW